MQRVIGIFLVSLFFYTTCHAEIVSVKVADNNVEVRTVYYDKEGKEEFILDRVSYGQDKITEDLASVNYWLDNYEAIQAKEFAEKTADKDKLIALQSKMNGEVEK